MCVIVACQPNLTPDVDMMIAGIKYNPDGHGFSFRGPNGLITWRGMDGFDGLEKFLRIRANLPDTYCFWHSRIATQGTVDEYNCHPFDVPGKGWVMAHNGILPLSDGPLDNRRSDSRIFAEDFLSEMNWGQLTTYHKTIDEWLGGSKIVVLTPHDVEGEPMKIIGEERGSWEDDGCWWSNLYHVPGRYKTVTSKQWTRPYEDAWAWDDDLTPAQIKELDDRYMDDLMSDAEEDAYFAKLEEMDKRHAPEGFLEERF